MLNQIVLVGRLAEEPTRENEERAVIVLSVPRSYKNEDGGYETDFITISLFKGIATNTMEYCKKGDVIGVKGRVQSNEGKIEIVAEKITFLSSKKED